LVILIVAFFIKNTTLIKTSYILLLVAGVVAMPVYFSGEGTEEMIEKLPGVSEVIIEKHEEVAKLAMLSIAAAGVFAFAALFSFKWQMAARVLKTLVLILAVTSGGLMAQTAHLGGQIRHTEIRNGGTLQNGNDTGAEKVSNGNDQQEEDQD